jgi:hypothetical protein
LGYAPSDKRCQIIGTSGNRGEELSWRVEGEGEAEAEKDGSDEPLGIS